MKHLLPFLALVVLTATPSQALPGGTALAGLIIEEFDGNADGKVSEQEWSAGVKDGFEFMDDNGNGELTAKELDDLNRHLAKRMGDLPGRLVSKLVKAVVLSLDTDKSRSVSRAEYEASASGIFRKVDADRDKGLSETELAQLPVRLFGK